MYDPTDIRLKSQLALKFTECGQFNPTSSFAVLLADFSFHSDSRKVRRWTDVLTCAVTDASGWYQWTLIASVLSATKMTFNGQPLSESIITVH